MVKLTIKQENFCFAYVETGNASEAYRRAYSTGKMKSTTINRNANALLSNNKITTRLDTLRKPVIEKVRITLESHLDELMKLRGFAVEKEQFGSAITAEIARGKAAGIYIEKSQIEFNNFPPMVIKRHGD